MTKDAAAFHVHWFILFSSVARAPIKELFAHFLICFCPTNLVSVTVQLGRIQEQIVLSPKAKRSCRRFKELGDVARRYSMG